MLNVKSEICNTIFRSASSLAAFENFQRGMQGVRTQHQEAAAFGSEPPKASKESDMVSEAAAAVEKARPVRAVAKVGRNEPCPCWSGKKYKNCCGQ